MVGKCHCCLKPRFRYMIVDQALGLDHFKKDNLVWKVPAVAVHYVAPDAARPRVHLQSGGGEAPWAPPVRDVLGIDPGLEHQLTRRIKDASSDDLTIRSAGGRRKFFGETFQTLRPAGFHPFQHS